MNEWMPDKYFRISRSFVRKTLQWVISWALLKLYYWGFDYLIPSESLIVISIIHFHFNLFNFKTRKLKALHLFWSDHKPLLLKWNRQLLGQTFALPMQRRQEDCNGSHLLRSHRSARTGWCVLGGGGWQGGGGVGECRRVRGKVRCCSVASAESWLKPGWNWLE